MSKGRAGNIRYIGGVTLYFISGLGVDRRTFGRLRLPGHLTVRHLEWIEPVDGETLSQYALRLARGIDTTEDFALVGLSFGGMIATEISKVLTPRQVVLISSASTARELPGLYSFLGRLQLHKAAPYNLVKRPTPLTHWFLGARTPEEKQLVRAILKDTSPRFLRWAVNSILMWRNEERPVNLYHIHGSADKVLPLRLVKADRVIQGAGHLVVFSHAELVSRIITEKVSHG